MRVPVGPVRPASVGLLSVGANPPATGAQQPAAVQASAFGAKAPSPAPRPPEASVPHGAVAAPQAGGLWARLGEGWKSLKAWALGLDRGPMLGREVLWDPSVQAPSAQAMKAAQALLRSRAAQEDQAIAALGPRAAAYRRVASLVEADAPARAALQGLLLDGRLTQPPLSGDGDLLAQFQRLAQGPLAHGLPRESLLADLVEECEQPTKLAQGGKGTCVATTMTLLLAREAPAEYARLVADLAQPQGQSQLQSGDRLRREADWASDEAAGRTWSMRLLQPALMEFGNGWQAYDASADAHRLLDQPDAPLGLWARFKGWLAGFELGSGQSPRAANRIAEALLGRDFKSVSLVGRWNREAVWAEAEACLTRGQAVPVGLAWINGGHKVLLERLSGGFAYYSNPWGQTERMPVEAFKARLRNLNLPQPA